MAVGLKLLHIVSDYNLIKVVQARRNRGGARGACPPNNLHKYAPPPKKKKKKMVCHFKKKYVCPPPICNCFLCVPPPPICNCFLRACRPQVCIVPVSNVAATNVYQFLEVLFVLGNRFFCSPQLPKYDEMSRLECFSKKFEKLAMRNLSLLDFKCVKD